MSIYQPPWASELLARNRKVGRTIWSTSEIYQRQTSTFTFEFGSGQNGRKRTEEQGVNDPSSTKVSTTRALRTGKEFTLEGGNVLDHGFWRGLGFEFLLEGRIKWSA